MRRVIHNLPTVQLRHTLPDGTSHVDWFLARDDDPDSRLQSIRLTSPLHEIPPGGVVDGTITDDHRRAYLAFEGPVSGGRGHVERLAAGVHHRLDDGSIVVSWTDIGIRQRVEARPIDGKSGQSVSVRVHSVAD